VEVMPQILIAWLPIVVLVGLWLFFMGRIGASRQRERAELVQHVERVESLLERIAAALERRTTA